MSWWGFAQQNGNLTTKGTKTDSKSTNRFFCAPLSPLLCLLCTVPELLCKTAVMREEILKLDESCISNPKSEISNFFWHKSAIRQVCYCPRRGRGGCAEGESRERGIS